MCCRWDEAQKRVGSAHERRPVSDVSGREFIAPLGGKYIP
jgi:hypothetical protein